MDIKCLTVLGETCKKTFAAMTANIEIGNVKVKEDERCNEQNLYSHCIPFAELNDNSQGELILGFKDEQFALLVAGSLAEKFGTTIPNSYGEITTSIMNDFLTILATNISLEWEKLNFKVKFEQPFLKDPSNQSPASPNIKSYLAIVNIGISNIIFRLNHVKKTKTDLAGKKIMIVDDSRLIRGVLSQALKQSGFEVIEAENGRIAVEKHLELKPDMTIMDINMPEMGGFDAIIKIRQTNPQARFIMLSSSSRKDEQVLAKNLNVETFLHKPIQTKDFLDAVNAALNN